MGDFNAEQYRQEHESDKEWGLRQKFIVAHHDKFDERRLLCLASCFINVECYGCSYPTGVMLQLKELITDIVDDVAEYRDEMKALTAVKFVEAGESAASPKKKPDSLGMSFVKSGGDFTSTDVSRESVQNNNCPHSSDSSSHGGKGGTSAGGHADGANVDKFYQLASVIGNLGELDNKQWIDVFHKAADKCKITPTVKFDFDSGQKCYHCHLTADFISVGRGSGANKKIAKLAAFEEAVMLLNKPHLRVDGGRLVSSNAPPVQMSNQGNFNPKSNLQSAQSIQSSHSPVRGTKRSYSEMVLSSFFMLDTMQKNVNEMSVLNKSAAFNKIPIDYNFRTELVNGEVRTGCTIVIGSEVVADALGESKRTAKREAVAKALQSLKQHCWTIRIKQSVDSDDSGVTRREVTGDSESVIPESNIGSKLLKKMGWVGGGVGKHGAGIAEPVSVTSVKFRQGLGLSSGKGIAADFADHIKKAIQNYVRSDDQNDLVFSSAFTKEERAIIHRVSTKFGLKSQSYGKGEQRFLSASRKRNAKQLYQYIQDQGGETSKYLIVPPGSS